jgi:signal transduction histidine kinase
MSSVPRSILSSRAPGEPQPVGWETFLALWEQAGPIRSILWNKPFANQRALLIEFLTKLREFFGVDFCFGFLTLNNGQFAEVGLPEASVDRLPANFSRHCLRLVSNPGTPVVWNDVSDNFGFRSTLITPITAPAGRSAGFLMLGHRRRKSYTAAELFLVQTLAAEVGRVGRELAEKNDYQHRLAATGHDVKNALQIIIGSAALIRHKLKGSIYHEEENLHYIETSAQQILDSINHLSAADNCDDVKSGPSVKPGVNIAKAIRQAIDASQRLAKQRGVEFVVVDECGCLDDVTLDQPMLLGILDTLVSTAALMARDETVRLMVQRDAGNLKVAVQGLGSNRTAESLQSLLAYRGARLEGPGNKTGEAPIYVSKYLDSVGGDVYLKSRPGETAEFTVCLPFESSAQPGRLKLEKRFDTKDIA